MMHLRVAAEYLPTVLTTPTESDPLSTLTYTLVLPYLRNQDDDPIPCRESASDLETLNGEFTAQIVAVLVTLSSLPDAVVDTANGVKLHILIAERRYSTLEPHCHHRLFSSHQLRLVEHPLPTLKHVRVLVVGPGGGQVYHEMDSSGIYALHPSVLWRLARCMPNLSRYELPNLWERFPIAYEYKVFNHYTRLWEGPWRDARWEFGDGLDELPSSLTSMKVHFWQLGIYDYVDDEIQRRALPDLVAPKDHDPLSASLSRLSHNLTELDLRAVISPNLFTSNQSWPNLKRFKIEFHPSTPDGKWYFRSPSPVASDTEPSYAITDAHYPPLGPDLNDDDEKWDDDYNYNGGRSENRCPDMFRVESNREALEPLLEAFGHALTRMPVIEDAELFTYLNWHPSDSVDEPATSGDRQFEDNKAVHRWSVRYRVEDGHKMSLVWTVGEWRPSSQVEAAFGGLAEMEWADFEYLDMRWTTRDKEI